MHAVEPTPDWLGPIRTYLALSAMLHFLWEMVQLPLFTIWRSGTWPDIAFAVVHCTAGDVLIAALALLAGLLLFADPVWPAKRYAIVAIGAVLIGVTYTVYSEWLNTAVRKSWTYSELMPIAPWLGTGASPLAQWLIVPATAFGIVCHRIRARTQR